MEIISIPSTFFYILLSTPYVLNTQIYIRSASELLENQDNLVARNSTRDIFSTSKIACLKECSTQHNCMFFGFHSNERKCSLYESTIYNSNDAENGWRFYRMKGCPYGWTHYMNSCYFINDKDMKSWEIAKMTCKQYDAALVEIHDQEEQNFIASICQLSDESSKYATNTFGFWIGGTDAATEGEWRWGRSGEKITFEAWLQDEPNSSGNEDCIMIHGNRNYEWIDLNCDALRNFICERNKPVPLKGDVYVRNSTENTENRDRFIEDDVFISVTKESNIDCMTLCSGKPTCLTYSFNAEQKLCHLRSAFLTDYASPTSPFVSNWRHFHMKGCPYLWREFGNSCYYFLNSVTLNWTDARIFCKEMVAKLAEIESYEEDIFLSSFAATLNASSTHTAAYRGYWIGGYFNEEQTWKWNATGNLFEYTNWGEHEPNGFTHENCLMMFPLFNYKWTDTLCSDHFNFICERDLNLDASTVSPQILIP